MQKQETVFVRQRRHPLVRIVLFGTPLVLCLAELGHPILDPINTIQMLSPIVIWWIALHIMMGPLFALMGWAVWLILEGVSGPIALISRMAACIFSVFAIGYEFAIGLVSGIVTLNARGFHPDQQQVIQQALSRLLLSPIFDRMAIFIILVGFVTIITAALALVRAGAPRGPILVLLGALFFALAHESPFGPMGNACFLIAAMWLELTWDTVSLRKAAQEEQPTPSVQEPSAIT